ncbi:MAG: glycosyltransferase [bacterium]
MLHLVHILEATTGGTRRHLRELALGLDPAEFRVDVVVSLRRDPDFARDLPLYRERGVGVYVIPMRRRVAPVADLVALVRLVRLLRRLRPDVVHAHSSKAGFLGRLAARVSGVRATVYTPHAFAFCDTGAPWRGRCYRALERMARPWTTRLIAVSRQECEMARELGFAAEQVVWIANGITPNIQQPTGNNQQSTSNNQHPKESREPASNATVTFLGRLCRQKGPDLFLAAIPAILEQVPEARFRIVGEGAWRDWLQRQVARQTWRERVTFDVAHEDVDVAAELAAATVLVMPSRWEGLPYVLLEALQAGTPVVAAGVGGVLDVAVDCACAALVPPNEPVMLAAAVSGLLRSPAERARLVAAGQERVKDFSLRKMIEQTAGVYRDAVAAGRAHRRWM